jgi:hypothetical protein
MKNILVLASLCSLLCCSEAKLDRNQALELVKSSFGFSDNSLFSVSGVSKVVSEHYVVKFTLKSSVDFYKARLSGIATKYKDWQFDTIQTEYGVSVSADDYINLYRQEEQLKRKVSQQINETMRTMETLSSAVQRFLEDNKSFKKFIKRPGGEWDIYRSDFDKELDPLIYQAFVPKYLNSLPRDAWGKEFSFAWGRGCGGNGLGGFGDNDFRIGSLGADSVAEEWIFDSSKAEANIVPASDLSEYNTDLVLISGKWVRALKFKSE